MKKNLMRLIMAVMMMSFLLFGCGNSEATVEPETEVPEVTMEEQETETEVEAEITEEPEVEEEVKEEETEAVGDMPEAQITTTVSDINGLSEYMKSLDLSLPHIVIYNPTEGYVIDMKEGEAYHLKAEDRIFYKYEEGKSNILSNMPNKEEETKAARHGNPIELGLGLEEVPDYSQFETPQIVLLGVGDGVEEASEKTITCYLYAPTE